MEKKKRVKVYDTSYLIRVKSEKLRNALEYCNENNLVLTQELRQVIELYSNKFIKEKIIV